MSELPNVSVEAVEEAKAFASTTVSRPEPVERPQVLEIDNETLLKVSISPEIKAALAAEGLTIDQDAVDQVIEESKVIEANTQHVWDAATSDETDITFVFPVNEPELVPVTPEAFRDLKLEINASFSELASLVLEQQRQIDEIEARLAEHNKRGGHKI